jgi:hypothetical protein
MRSGILTIVLFLSLLAQFSPHLDRFLTDESHLPHLVLFEAQAEKGDVKDADKMDVDVKEEGDKAETSTKKVKGKRGVPIKNPFSAWATAGVPFVPFVVLASAFVSGASSMPCFSLDVDVKEEGDKAETSTKKVKGKRGVPIKKDKVWEMGLVSRPMPFRLGQVKLTVLLQVLLVLFLSLLAQFSPHLAKRHGP